MEAPLYGYFGIQKINFTKNRTVFSLQIPSAKYNERYDKFPGHHIWIPQFPAGGGIPTPPFIFISYARGCSRPSNRATPDLMQAVYYCKLPREKTHFLLYWLIPSDRPLCVSRILSIEPNVQVSDMLACVCFRHSEMNCHKHST